jgi:hypothetical protein
MPRRHHRQCLARIQPAVKVNDQAVRQRREGAQFAKIRHTVKDSHLYRPKVR